MYTVLNNAQQNPKWKDTQHSATACMTPLFQLTWKGNNEYLENERTKVKMWSSKIAGKGNKNIQRK